MEETKLESSMLIPNSVRGYGPELAPANDMIQYHKSQKAGTVSHVLFLQLLQIALLNKHYIHL